MVDLPSKVHDCITELIAVYWTVTEIVQKGEPRVSLTRQNQNGIDTLVIMYRGTPSIIKDDTLGAWSIKSPHYQVVYHCSRGSHMMHAYYNLNFEEILGGDILFSHAKDSEQH